ncbi:unnamed protein product [Ambrosiozyma monospora]|uniref:Unnamed protein product n=1 Tax=Ambrosiozyma monospora TaxID=43982 RepID=A0ACB5T7A0_AMBMO|nr:unnamed protein product [Ambrosiozyma monospora]
MFKAPYLVNAHGQVNEGVFQSIMLVNYAKIFTHRPFSYLWRPDVSRHPRCSDEAGVTDNCQTLKKQDVDSRKIIETRKTIDSASSVVKSLLDTNPAQVLQRTPFLACALAFSCLVHLSAYSWVESSLQVLETYGDAMSASLRDNISREELGIYSEYIKLELGGIFQISRHWALSNKLIAHIRETLMKVSPKLYKMVQSSLPEGHLIHQQVENPAPIPQHQHQQRRTSSLRNRTQGRALLEMSTSGTGTTTTNDLFSESDTNSPHQISTGSTGYNTPLVENHNDIFQQQQQQQPSSVIAPLSSSNVAAAAAAASAIPGQQISAPEFNEIDFNLMFDGSLSPSSDTGCEWVDKHIFEFDAYSLDPPNTT